MATTMHEDDGREEAEALDAYSRVVAGVAEQVSPSVASLRLMRRTRGGRMPSGAGSAVVLTPDGFLLTCAHVIGGPPTRPPTRPPTHPSRSGRATFVDGRDVGFEVLGVDRLSDLAVLRADAHDLAPA